MKARSRLLAILCVTLCLSLVFSTGAYGAPNAKQLLIQHINEADFTSIYDQMYQASSGTCVFQLNELSGAAITGIDELNDLNGASLSMGYKLNTAKKQLELNYDLSLQQDNYQGNVYFTDEEFIFTAESLINILRTIYPDPTGLDETNLLLFMRDPPQYFYASSDEMDALWSTLNQGTYPDELKDLLVFFVEAIPEKYASLSLRNQSVVFSLDSAGLADVIHCVIEKAINEPDRMVNILTSCLANSGVSKQDLAEIRADLLYELQDMKDYGIPSVIEIKREIERLFVLKSLRLEKSLISKNVSITLNGDFAKDSGIVGSIRANYNTTGDKDKYDGTANFNLEATLAQVGSGSANYKLDFQSNGDRINGNYNLDIGIRGDEMLDMLNVSCAIKGYYDYSATNIDAQDEIKISVHMDGVKQLSLSLASDVAIKYDPEVSVNIPKLTPANSMNLENIGNTDNIRIYVDGHPVTTHSIYGDIVIPVRETAVLLGCQVEWVEPDEIIITRNDETIVIYLDAWMYTANGEGHFIYPSVTLYEGKAVAPVQLFTEALDCTIIYNGQSNSVNIKSK